MSFIVPPLPPGTDPQFQVWWQQAMENLAVNINRQDRLIQDINNALSASGVALTTAYQRMPSPAPLFIIPTDPGALPKTQQIYRYEGGTDVTLDSEWSVSVKSGSISATIGAATGLLNITALGSDSVLEIMSIRDGVPLSVLQGVYIPASGGGGGGGGSSGYTVLTKSITSSISATTGETLVLANGPITLSLATAVGNTAIIHVKLISGASVTIDPAGTETIDGSATVTLSSIGDVVTLYSDNTNWRVV